MSIVTDDATAAAADRFVHEPVMLHEILEVLSPVPSGIFVDATLGGAGHARNLLERRSDLRLIGIDRDPVARSVATSRLSPFADRVSIQAGRFDEIAALVEAGRNELAAGDTPVTAVLFDLGVSSPQLDHAERGFSYRHDAPLDMRMNPDDGLTAADIVNTWDHQALTHVLRDGADEKFASRVAARIIDNRPIDTTLRLAEVVVDAIPAATRRTGGHPAKRTFQALRIAVNDELDQIPAAIADAVSLLAPGGRGAVLSYHSGEDRLVKRAIAEAESGGCTCPPRLPCACGAQALVRALAPRQRVASDDEQRANPRSTSARLRCFERLDHGGASA